MSETAIVPFGGGGGSQLTNLLLNEDSFARLQKAAAMFAASPLVPQHLKGGSKTEGIANCAIALAMAHEMGENPLTLMQGIYVVHGRAGWSAQYMISRANSSGLLKGRIRWRKEGTGSGLVVTAYATLKDEPDEEITAEVSMQMAKDEGWTKNSKYRTMPDHMLRWRSATFLIRSYLPEVMMGYGTREEIEDMNARSPRDVTPPAEMSTEHTQATAVVAEMLGLNDEPAGVVEPPVSVEAEIVGTEEGQAGFAWAPGDDEGGE